MSDSRFEPGKLVGVCFMIVWCSIAFGMGITALQMGAPFIFPMAAFGMGSFGVVMCICIARGGTGAGAMAISRRRDDMYTYSGDAFSTPVTTHSRDRERELYQVPSRCPSCGASISTEDVDWVGPLQARCPYCGDTMDAEKRIL
jgi:hypothetical protein